MMHGNDNEQRRFFRAVAVGVGAIAGGAIGGPIGAAVAAGGVLVLVEGIENLPQHRPQRIENLPQHKPPSLVILAARATQFRKYLSHLSPGQKITDKTACELLYENSKYIWRGTQKEFEILKEEIGRLPAENPNDESAFYLAALKTDEDLPGLRKDASLLERRDALLALAGKAEIIWTSPPITFKLLCQQGLLPCVTATLGA